MIENEEPFRYFFEVAYKGTNYHGWQLQNNATTVQEVINNCLSKLLGQSVNITGSGRTDKGVHCAQQYFHLDSNQELNRRSLQYKLNAFLPEDVSIQSILRVNKEAHARFDASLRAYQYKISTRKDPFIKGLAYYYDKKLDVRAMNEACKMLLGTQDFESFSKVKTEVNNFMCTLYKAEWVEDGAFLLFNVEANRFLRGMVRCMVGTLLEVGLGRRDLDNIQEVLGNKDRKLAGRAVPAEGLYLCQVQYPESIFLEQ